MTSTIRLLLVLLALSGLGQSEAQAQTCSQLTTLNYAKATNGDRRASSTAVGGTTVTTSGYSSSVPNSSTSYFEVGTNNALPSKALVWQQNTQGAAGAVAGQPTTAATVTYTFSRAVTNLTLVLSDIDADASAGKFTDNVTLDGYENAADATPITLTATDVSLGNSNTFVAGSNAIQGTGNSNADAANNVTVTFPQPVTKLVISYQNAYPYNSADNRTQAMGINSIAFCSGADVYAQFTAGPTTAIAGQNVAYTVAFGNNGPDIAATTVTRKVTIPAGATVTNLGGGTLTGGALDFGNVASLASGSSSSFTFAYNLPLTPGTYTNTATITAATTATAYDPTANNSASRSVLVSAGATPCTTAPVELEYRTRPNNENWKAKVLDGVPVTTSVTKVSTTYTSADNSSTLAVGALTGTTLRWSVDYAGDNGGDPNTSTVTYTFSRPVSNFSVRVQDIDGNVSGNAGSLGRSGFVDQVTFAGSNTSSAVTPLVSKVVPTSTTVTVSGATATGSLTGATSADDGAVIASFPNEITSLTITYRNVVTGTGLLGAGTTYAAQAIGIDLMSWCRLAPVANAVANAALPSSAGQVNINGLSSAVDGVVQYYTLRTLPSATLGVLYYNSNGSTYTAAAAGQTLTAAQAATLRFDPAAGASGSATFSYAVTDDADLVSNDATYTIPVNNVTCAVNTTAVNFASRPAAEDWKAHATERFPAGSPRTTMNTSGYTTPGSATTSTFLTAQLNGVQTLQWLTDYANTTAKSSSVTFNFNRAVTNFAVRVQDIDAAQDNNNSFIDQIAFSGSNGGTAVTPVLSAVNPDNGSVIINGNVAIGTVNNTSTDDASVVAYFASPITSLTLTYTNNSTYSNNPTAQAVGIDMMSWCQLAPTATTIANASLPASAPQTAITALTGTADGVIQMYTLSTLPTAASGVLYVNGVAATPGQTITAAQAAQLTFDPNPAFSGTAAFTYTANDAQGNISPTANYTIPVTEVADVTTTLSGPASLNPGQPSGTYTATFINLGPSTATAVTQTVTLPVGATNVLVNGAVYTPSGNTINFGTAATLASGATNAFTFSYTPATTATGTLALVSTASTTTPEGANTAPNTSALNATVAQLADVATTITATTASVAAGTLASAGTPPKYTATFSNSGPAAAAGVTATVQLPAGLTNVTATNGGVYNSTTGVISYAALTSLANGATTTSVITFDAPAAGPVLATATIATTNPEANQTANNQASASMSITPAFDLFSTLSGPDTAVQGNLVTLALTTTNNGPSAAPKAAATIQLVAGLSNVFVSNGGSYDSATGLVTFPISSSLPNGQTVTNSVSFRAPATAFAPFALVTPNTAIAGETSIANNTGYLNGAATSTNMTFTGVTTDKSNIYTRISTTTPGPNAGSLVGATVVTGNNGPMPATSVVQTAQLLPGLAGSIQIDGVSGTLSSNMVTFASGATYNNLTGIVTYPAIASQASGNSVSSTITFTVPANVANNGQLVLMAAVRNSNSDPVPSDNVANTTVVVMPTTDLTTTITGPASVIAGQPVRYTATFVNNGPSMAGGYQVSGSLTSGVVETAQLPTGLSTVTITDAAGAVVSGANYDATTGLVTFPTLATDPVGATQLYNISFVAPATSYVVRGSVRTATPDGNLAGNNTSLATAVTPAADLTTTIAGPASAVAGNAVTYSITTTNAGPSTATSVVPTIQLATGLTTVSVPNGNYSSATGLVTFNTTASLVNGASVTNSVTFLMPASAQTTGVANATSSTIDRNAGNAAASVATSLAPATAVAASATSAAADVVAAVSAVGSVAANAPLTFTAVFSNNGTDAASNVQPTLQLPAGLVVGTISDGGVYNAVNGLVTWPVIASLANAGSASYTVALTAPATDALVTTAMVSAATSEPATTTAQANDVAQATVTITTVFDEVTSLSGPTSAMAGTSQTYTVTATNNGPSPTGNNTTQTVTLPAGVTATNISNSGTQTGNVITWTIPAGQVAGAAGAVANSFTMVQPAAGAPLSAAVALPGESNTGNSTTSLTTAATNQPPVAYTVVNSLQGPRGNTATQLPISPLRATDPENAFSTMAAFTLVTVPTAAQGVVYYDNGTSYVAAAAGQALTAAQAAALRFQPATGYVGNAAFTYLTTDNVGNPSMTVNYTIPVAADMSSTYQVYNSAKGGSIKYVTNDVLAQVIDPNTVMYNSSSILYNATGDLQSGAANGLATTGTNAVLASGTLPSGISLDPATGRIYVSNAALLPRITAATSYPVTITTTDLNGGTNTVPVTFTLGAYPLPVELVAFTAKAVNNLDASLAWTTASEKNNDHFEVERSLNGTDYLRIGQVQGQGSKSSATDYALTDAGIGAKASGPVYYRLKQVDTDGTFSYSPVRSVSFTKVLTPAIALFPNPATASTTTLDLSQLPAGSYEVSVLDATGRVVLHAVRAAGVAQALELNTVASGTYTVRVLGQGLNLTKRIIKE